MRRYAKSLILTIGMGAFDSATGAAGPEIAEQSPAPAAARSLVTQHPGTGTCSRRGLLGGLRGDDLSHSSVVQRLTSRSARIGLACLPYRVTYRPSLKDTLPV
jgi:hypothetical protein